MVCLQFQVNDGAPQIIHAKDPARFDVLEWAFSKSLGSGHNVAFDLAVLCAHEPDLIGPVFDWLERDGVVCTAVRQKLSDIATGCFEGNPERGTTWGYSLAECSQRLSGIELDKSDPWRLKYGTLYHTPVSRWPAAALAYALGDAKAQHALHTAQDAKIPAALLVDQFRQTRAAFWLRLMECRGIRTDAEQIDRYHASVLADLDRDKAVALAQGLIRPNGVKDTKAAMERMVRAMAKQGEEPTLTKAGEKRRKELAKAENRPVQPFEIWKRDHACISVDEDSCAASADVVLEAYQRVGSAQTTISRVERLRHGIHLPLQASFQSIVETGRTSCRMGDVKDTSKSPTAWGTQLQNMPRKEGLRECFIPRPGFIFCSVDYDGMELRTWAQVCLWAIGRSRMAEVLNNGKDPHTELGARLAKVLKEEAYAILRGERGPELKKIFKDKWRQTGKIGNFGFPGGMGPKTMRVQARKGYGVSMTLVEATNLRDAWREEWDEAPDYFAWVNSQLEDKHARADLLTDDGRKIKRGYFKTFLSGRLRGPIAYTQASNNGFQGLASDAAKAAGFVLAKECYADTSSALYGSRPVVFNHDEFILEVPDHPERAHLAAMRQRDVMVSVAQGWVPDVKISAEPALMRRWSKNASPKYRGDLLIPWEDK